MAHLITFRRAKLPTLASLSLIGPMEIVHRARTVHQSMIENFEKSTREFFDHGECLGSSHLVVGRER